MKIHHIGYLVKKMSRAIDTLCNLGFEIESETIFDDYRQIDICFLKKDGYRIELVSPNGKNSIVSNLIKRTGNSPYHLCYESKNLDKDLEHLANHGYLVMHPPMPAPAINNKRVAFLMNGSIGIIELVEET